MIKIIIIIFWQEKGIEIFEKNMTVAEHKVKQIFFFDPDGELV